MFIQHVWYCECRCVYCLRVTGISIMQRGIHVCIFFNVHTQYKSSSQLCRVQAVLGIYVYLNSNRVYGNLFCITVRNKIHRYFRYEKRTNLCVMWPQWLVYIHVHGHVIAIFVLAVSFALLVFIGATYCKFVPEIRSCLRGVVLRGVLRGVVCVSIQVCTCRVFSRSINILFYSVCQNYLQFLGAGVAINFVP